MLSALKGKREFYLLDILNQLWFMLLQKSVQCSLFYLKEVLQAHLKLQVYIAKMP